MTAWFASGHAVDFVLAVIALEGAWLMMLRRADPAAAVLLLLPGVLMLPATRAVLAGQG